MVVVSQKGGGKRPPSHRGAYYVKKHGDGFILAAWPKKKDRPLSQRQTKSVQLFREAAEATKRMDPAEQMAARIASQATQLLPRDLLFMALYGRLGYIILDNGERFYPVAALADLTELLDMLGWDEGTLVYRGKDFWAGLPAPILPSVLTFNPETGQPEWSTGAAGGAIKSTLVRRLDTTSPINTWPAMVPYQEAIYDDFDAWSPDDPELLTVPEGVTRIRLSAMVSLANANTARSYYISFREVDLNTDYPAYTAQNLRLGTTGFTSNHFLIQSPWIPVEAGQRFYTLVNFSPATSSAFIAENWFQMEGF